MLSSRQGACNRYSYHLLLIYMFTFSDEFMCLLYCVCIAVFTLDAGLLARRHLLLIYVLGLVTNLCVFTVLCVYCCFYFGYRTAD